MDSRVELRFAFADVDASEKSAHPRREIRPLGRFSDFICNDLGQINQEIREAHTPPEELFHVINDMARLEVLPRLTRLPRALRRTAMLDVVWGERSLAVAFGQDAYYGEHRNSTPTFAAATQLSRTEMRHPHLSWSDIAIYHPIYDPRSFLEPSVARDQEIMMYRVQGGIDKVFKHLLQLPYEFSPHSFVGRVVDDLTLVCYSMARLTKVREVGQFGKLDPFLMENGEVTGHATGSFSAWSLIMAHFLAPSDVYVNRLTDPANLWAFDTDSRRFIRAIEGGFFLSLQQRIGATKIRLTELRQLEDALESSREKMQSFFRIHKAAVKKHSPGSLRYPAPASPLISNAESFDLAIEALDLSEAKDSIDSKVDDD